VILLTNLTSIIITTPIENGKNLKFSKYSEIILIVLDKNANFQVSEIFFLPSFIQVEIYRQKKSDNEECGEI
jgi:predicted secreted protein